MKQIARMVKKLEPPQLISCGALSVGKERNKNEDALFTLASVLASEKKDINFGIFIIADGLGGHEGGDIASQVAVRAMADHLIKNYYNAFFSLNSIQPEMSIQEIMETGVQKAHQAVLEQKIEGGTTLTALLVLGSRMSLAHVGDSRAYEISAKGDMKVLTRSHSFAERLVELGELTPEEAETHPKRHDLYRVLGMDVSAEPDVFSAPLPTSGHLLLCSDGLWGVVPAGEISRIIDESPDLQTACIDLVDAANAAGGPDNISLILIQVPN